MTRDCAATGRGCGSPSGWRRGGRCPRCRAAHTTETRKRRGLSGEQREQALKLLRAGISPETVERQVGRAAGSLARIAGRDSELRALLDGRPEPEQRMMRRMDYLHTLASRGGNIPDACEELGITPSTVKYWRETDSGYAAVEQALVEWVTRNGARRRQSVTNGQLDEVAKLICEGATVKEAAAQAGVDIHHVAYWRTRHEGLREALGARRPRGLTKEREGRLLELWGDPAWKFAGIARELGVSEPTLAAWAGVLRLPRRTAIRDLRPEPMSTGALRPPGPRRTRQAD